MIKKIFSLRVALALFFASVFFVWLNFLKCAPEICPDGCVLIASSVQNSCLMDAVQNMLWVVVVLAIFLFVIWFVNRKENKSYYNNIMFKKFFGKLAAVALGLGLLATILLLVVPFLPLSFGLIEFVNMCFGECTLLSQYTDLGNQLRGISLYTIVLCFTYLAIWATYWTFFRVSDFLFKK